MTKDKSKELEFEKRKADYMEKYLMTHDPSGELLKHNHKVEIENKDLQAENKLLKEGLIQIKNDVGNPDNDNDTVWVGDCETLWDRIESLLNKE